MAQLLGTLLGDGELSLLKVGEKISAVELFHDDVNVILILKDIQ